jgi:hypothetical protein
MALAVDGEGATAACTPGAVVGEGSDATATTDITEPITCGGSSGGAAQRAALGAAEVGA